MAGDSVPLLKHINALLSERDKRQEQRFRGTEKAIKKAEASVNKRLDLLNELRGNVATRDQLDAMAQRVADMKTTLDTIAGRSGGKWQSWLVLVAAVATAGVLFAIASYLKT